MSLEADIATLLRTNAALTSTPIQYASDPQALAVPKITLQTIQQRIEYSNDGEIGFCTAWVQIDVIAISMSDPAAGAIAIARQIRTTLSGFVGTAGSTAILCAILDNQWELAGEIEAGREKPAQKVVQSWKISYRD